MKKKTQNTLRVLKYIKNFEQKLIGFNTKSRKTNYSPFFDYIMGIRCFGNSKETAKSHRGSSTYIEINLSYFCGKMWFMTIQQLSSHYFDCMKFQRYFDDHYYLCNTWKYCFLIGWCFGVVEIIEKFSSNSLLPDSTTTVYNTAQFIIIANEPIKMAIVLNRKNWKFLRKQIRTLKTDINYENSWLWAPPQRMHRALTPRSKHPVDCRHNGLSLQWLRFVYVLAVTGVIILYIISYLYMLHSHGDRAGGEKRGRRRRRKEPTDSVPNANCMKWIRLKMGTIIYRKISESIKEWRWKE